MRFLLWIAEFETNVHPAEFFATGVVILISIAIAAGVVFLLALIGILWTLFSRSDDKLNKMDPVMDDDDDSVQHRPSSLLEHINAATRTTIIGNSPFAAAAAGYERDDEREKHGEHGDPFGPDASNYLRAETPSDVMGGMLGDEMSRPAHARYSFDGAGEGELPLVAGAEVEILDDRDAACVTNIFPYLLRQADFLSQLVVCTRCENWPGGCGPSFIHVLDPRQSFALPHLYSPSLISSLYLLSSSRVMFPALHNVFA